MNNIIKLISASALALSMSHAFANEDKFTAVDFNQFYETQVASAQCGGYWDERQVEVCDYKTELVDVSYKTCNYELRYAAANSSYPASATRTVLANQACPNNWTVGSPSGMSPGGVYVHTYDSFFTQQEPKTVKYNCRIETKVVWVPSNGQICP